MVFEDEEHIFVFEETTTKMNESSVERHRLEREDLKNNERVFEEQ